MLKRKLCEGGGINGILKFFSSHLGSELWICGDRKLIRFFSGCGKMRLIKRKRIDFFQFSFLPDLYISVFLQHLLSYNFIFTGIFLGLDYPLQYLHRTFVP